MNSTPEGAGDDDTETWTNMRRMIFELLLNYWPVVDDGSIFMANTHFDVWEVDGLNYSGMRDDETGEP